MDIVNLTIYCLSCCTAAAVAAPAAAASGSSPAFSSGSPGIVREPLLSEKTLINPFIIARSAKRRRPQTSSRGLSLVGHVVTTA